MFRRFNGILPSPTNRNPLLDHHSHLRSVLFIFSSKHEIERSCFLTSSQNHLNWPCYTSLISMWTFPTNRDRRQIARSHYAVEQANQVSVDWIRTTYIFRCWTPISTGRDWCRVLVRRTVRVSYYANNTNFSRGDYRNCDIPLWTAKAILTYAAQIEQVSHCL